MLPRFSNARVRRAARCLAVAWALLAALSAGAADMATMAPNDVPEEIWDRPRSGRTLLVVPAIRQALAALAADPQSGLVVRHAPGAEPSAQAEELKAWLVAHAVAPARITLRADLPARRPIRLDITTAGGAT